MAELALAGLLGSRGLGSSATPVVQMFTCCHLSRSFTTSCADGFAKVGFINSKEPREMAISAALGINHGVTIPQAKSPVSGGRGQDSIAAPLVTTARDSAAGPNSRATAANVADKSPLSRALMGAPKRLAGGFGMATRR